MNSRHFIRQFSQTTTNLKTGYSTVLPVHHLVKVEKAKLKPCYSEVVIPSDDIRSNKFKPTEIDQDRVQDHYYNTLESDLLLKFYEHDSKTIPGLKKREWGTDSPFKVFRKGKRKPKGSAIETQDIIPINYQNIPKLNSIVINSYNKNALERPWMNICTRLQLATITNKKPKILYNKSNILPWKVRRGKECGAKVELFDREMNQFITTLTEIVLPRLRAFEGIKLTSGDTNGNITFGLNADDILLFPEIENFQELYPNLNGMDITFKTSARTDQQAKTLLSSYGFPFYKPVKNSG
ncbi:unnamed protein product [Candida verbasci]|uniref:Large ribosomal subunit protein uL5m n=1 Tax=Candida verbasci TaxID=1227364 RepID=A0A9W4TTF8_9ASCO|nr:unnamed protein product [Candida verbasci]